MPDPRASPFLPCPFCGGKPSWDRYSVAAGKGAGIRCGRCGAMVYVSNAAGGLEEAARRWNTRLQAPAVT